MTTQAIRSTSGPVQPLWTIACSAGRFLVRCAPVLAASAAGIGVPVRPSLIIDLRAANDQIREVRSS